MYIYVVSTFCAVCNVYAHMCMKLKAIAMYCVCLGLLFLISHLYSWDRLKTLSSLEIVRCPA